MLDAGEDAAPVKTTDGFVNVSADLNVDAGAFQDFVIYTAQQIQQAALVAPLTMDGFEAMARRIEAGVCDKGGIVALPSSKFIFLSELPHRLMVHDDTTLSTNVRVVPNTAFGNGKVVIKYQ